MSDPLVSMVTASLGPGSVSDLLDDALRELRQRYPACPPHRVWLQFHTYERSGTLCTELRWSLSAGALTGHGDDRGEALAALAEQHERQEKLKSVAVQLVSDLRPHGLSSGMRQSVLREALVLLDAEEAGTP